MENKIAVLIPAHNEEAVIAKTIQAVLKILPKKDIFVVSDGSVDNTVEIAKSLVTNVLVLNNSHGKAEASNIAIKEFNIINNYQFLMPMDADTLVSAEFLNELAPILINDINEEIICAVGKVIGQAHNWLTMYRLWEYEIAQAVHKRAQAKEGAIMVCPGCATIYRTKVFINNSIPNGTLTEDMDFTFQIHRQKLGRIEFNPKAVVITQDPASLRDYLKQIDRWYTGFWQSLIKHNIPWGGQTLDLEVGLLALEGLFNGLLVVLMLILIPIVIKMNPKLLLVPFSVDLIFFLIPTLIYTAAKNRKWKIFLYIPHFYLMRFMSSLIFLKSFIKTLFTIDLKMKWGEVARY